MSSIIDAAGRAALTGGVGRRMFEQPGNDALGGLSASFSVKYTVYRFSNVTERFLNKLTSCHFISVFPSSQYMPQGTSP